MDFANKIGVNESDNCNMEPVPLVPYPYSHKTNISMEYSSHDYHTKVDISVTDPLMKS